MLDQVRQEFKAKISSLEKEYNDALNAVNKQLAASGISGEKLSERFGEEKLKMTALKDEKVSQLEKAFDQAKKELGWQPKISVKEGIRRLTDWVVNNESYFS